METVSQSLFKYFDGKDDLCRYIVVDLFGMNNWNKHMLENEYRTIEMFLGIYRGLYKMKVSAEEIFRCFKENRLDELIHIKYSFYSYPHLLECYDYYKEFVDNQYSIGNTYYKTDESTQHSNIPLIYTVILPSYHFFSNAKRKKSNLNRTINNKINKYKLQDIDAGREITDNYININDVRKLLTVQDYKCYICCDTVLTSWVSFCLYQMTLDRIDNSLPHDKYNVLISCYSCNCHENLNHSQATYKLCKNKCHTIKREKIRTRYQVPMEEIQSILEKYKNIV